VTLSIEFLGTGTSTGVPVIGCDCPRCTSTDPRDRRLRSSVVIRQDNVTLLVDTTPDLREQALQARLRHIDAVLYTHPHADHTAGLDELRSFNAIQDEHIPVWATDQTASELRERFAYAFADTFPRYGLKPDLLLNLIDGPFTVKGVEVTPIPIMHGWLPIVGFRVGDIAYLTDLKTIPDESRALLDGVDILVITALRNTPHPAHLTLDEALIEIERIGPRQAYLTHISHEFGLYTEIQPNLPENVSIGIDGTTVESRR
jgi:phosphoribosyl 1,2-cyclic phosphate phosphodiesterase